MQTNRKETLESLITLLTQYHDGYIHRGYSFSMYMEGLTRSYRTLNVLGAIETSDMDWAAI